MISNPIQFNMFSRFDRILVCDRQTDSRADLADRQTDGRTDNIVAVINQGKCCLETTHTARLEQTTTAYHSSSRTVESSTVDLPYDVRIDDDVCCFIGCVDVCGAQSQLTLPDFREH